MNTSDSKSSPAVRILKFALIATLPLLSPSLASAAVVYTSSYLANALPSATAGTTADPLWHIGASGGTASVANGILSVSTTTITSNQFWAVGNSSANTAYAGSTPGVWNTSTATIDFRLQVTAQVGTTTSTARGGFTIQVTDQTSANSYTFHIGTTGFTYSGTSGLSAEGYDNSSGFKNYRIVIKDGKASFYVEGIANPIFKDVTGAGVAGRNAILFGDISSGVSGSYNLDYLQWSNSVAEFAAPIPEPGVTALLGLFLGGATLAPLRRKLNARKN